MNINRYSIVLLLIFCIENTFASSKEDSVDNDFTKLNEDIMLNDLIKNIKIYNKKEIEIASLTTQ